VAQHVEESGGDDHAGGVDHFGRSLIGRDCADGLDPIRGDADIGAAQRRAGPIGDLAAADQDIEGQPVVLS
jgi:hypothetical protein